MSYESHLKDLETMFLALADKTRLRLLNLMRESEICVCFFTEVLGESQPKISRHLAYLRNAGLVSARRDGKWMHYKIEIPEDETLAEIFTATLNAIGKDDNMQAEYEDLIAVCCSPNAPVVIERAPKPDTLLDANMTDEPSAELETFLL